MSGQKSSDEDLLIASAQEIAASERLLKVAQAAILCNCSPRTIWRHVRSRKLRAVRTAWGAVRIPLTAIKTSPLYLDQR